MPGYFLAILSYILAAAAHLLPKDLVLLIGRVSLLTFFY
jgi:hypothetical protein